MGGLWADLRYAWRTLRARPGFTAVAVLTLALGVAANIAVFRAVNALWLRPLPIEDVDRLAFGMALREGFDPFGVSLLEYALYRDDARTLATSGLGAPQLFNLVGHGEPERLRGASVMASYLATLGVRPALGRLFTSEDDRPGGPAVALVGYGLWQRRFGRDPAVIGRELLLDERPHTIVGVMPPGFDLPYSAEGWVPMQVSIASLPLAQQAATANEFVARLKPGVSLAQADAELKTLARRLEREHPEIRRGWSFGLVPLRRQLIADIEGRTTHSLVALLVGVAFLLLICCANVAGLLLARGVAREGEIAIRRSLGAGQGRLVRQLLSESVLLAGLGGALGALLALWIQPLLSLLNPVQPVGLGAYLTDFGIDLRVLLFSLAVTSLTAAIFGVVPAVKAAHASDPASVLKRREQHGGGGAGGWRTLETLVVAEITVAATLLAGGSLMLQSFRRLSQMELGFRPAQVLTMELPLSPTKYADPTRQDQFMDQVLERVRAVPGVLAAGMTTNVPMQRGVTFDAVFEVEGHPPVHPGEVPITAHRLVSPGYLETLGVTLVEGRLLDDGDRASSAPVVVVSDELVRRSWPGEDPLGKRVRRIRAGQRGPWMTVVGVVKDVKEDRFGFRIDRPVWYAPHSQQTFPLPASAPLNLVVRTAGDPTSVATAVRDAVHAVDRDQPVASLMKMTDYLSDVLVNERFSAVLAGALAALGLVLAAIGLYGVMAYSVGRRTGEIGLRMALGAAPRDVARLVLGHGAALVAIGLGLGFASAFALNRLLSATLYRVSPGDPATLVLVALALACVALLACWLPARRAARVSPMVALRSD